VPGHHPQIRALGAAAGALAHSRRLTFQFPPLQRFLLPRRDPGEDNPEGGTLDSWATRATADGGLQGAPGKAARVDIYRDTPVRYCGYANELGEAFAAWVPAWGVPLSYVLAITYVLADTVDKTGLAYGKAGRQLERSAPGEDTKTLQKLVASGVLADTLIWQLLASVAIPGFTIHQVVHFSHVAMAFGFDALDANLEPLQSSPAILAGALGASLPAVQGLLGDPVARDLALKTGPTVVGLLAIPLIVHPIDAFVHLLLNKTLRPLEQQVICGRADGVGGDLSMCEIPVDKGLGHEWSTTMIKSTVDDDDGVPAVAGDQIDMAARQETFLRELDEFDAKRGQVAPTTSISKSLRAELLSQAGMDEAGGEEVGQGGD